MRYGVIRFLAVAIWFFQPAATLAQTAERSIREIQQALADNGYATGPADGVWGKRSISALKAFQRARGLPESGVIDGRVTRELFPTPLPKVETSATISASEKALKSESPEPSPPITRVQETQPEQAGASSVTTPAPAAPPSATPAPVPDVSQQTIAVVAHPPAGAGRSEGSGLMGLGALAGGVTLLIVAYRSLRKRRPDRPQIPETEMERSREATVPRAAPAVPGTGIESVALRAHPGDKPETPVGPTISAPTARPILDHRQDQAEPQPSPRQPVEAGEQVTPGAAVHIVQPRQLAQAGKPLFGVARRVQENSAPLPPSHSGWVPAGASIKIGDISIGGGMIYVGGHLPKKGASYENENCLINPKVAVSRNGDPSGRTMGYWPSYSQITPEARRSYLEWLAGSRSDPLAYIGYVFLYFYGLERRVMLEADAPDAAEVVEEVRRLLDVYGQNHSFNRYANELLSAVQVKLSPPDVHAVPEVEGNGFEVPTAIKMALGLRVRDGRPIEPRLLFRFARTHPETRVRTPARRAPELLEALFVHRIEEQFPQGLRVSGGRFKMLKAHYRACSGSFDVEVAAVGGSIPDISERAEPITTARTTFERCSDELDDYSRALGRSPGLKPTLSIVSKLPDPLRLPAVENVPGRPLEKIATLARNLEPPPLKDLGEVLELDFVTSVGKSKLREAAALLGSLGFGITADPAYALRQPTADEQVMIFELQKASCGPLEPSPAYRAVQLSVMLGMAVGHADGSFDDSERGALIAKIETAGGLSADERTRLKAELGLVEKDSARLSEWTKRLKDVPLSAKNVLAAELVDIAASDGAVHAAEVKALEGLFKRMGLDQQYLYTLLHESGSSRKDDEPSTIIAATEGVSGSPIPPEPAMRTVSKIDLSRLNAIRTETRATASVLADIFLDETETSEAPSTIEVEIEEHDMFEGLERRYGSLVTELLSQETWAAADFDILARTAGLMPGAAREAVNDWAMDRYDDLLIEGDGPFVINSHLLPSIPSTAGSANVSESAYA